MRKQKSESENDWVKDLVAVVFFISMIPFACLGDCIISVFGWHYCDGSMKHWRQRDCKICNYPPNPNARYPEVLK